MSKYSDLRVAEGAIEALGDMNAALSSTDRAGMKVEMDAFLAAESDPGLRACVLFYYVNQRADLEGRVPTVEEFENFCPPWEALNDPLSKLITNFNYIDQAWQCVAEGKGDLARAYFERTRDTALRMMAEHPGDAAQTWIVDNLMRAVEFLGPAETEKALGTLRDIIAKGPPSVLSWGARYHVALHTPAERKALLAEMLDQFDDGFLDAALASPDVSRDVKSMLELLKGHVLLGNGRYEEAIAQYDRVLEVYANRVEWVPRKAGRTLENPQEYGVRGMAAYSKALAVKGLHGAKAIETVDEYERFLEKFPRSEKVPKALFELGNVYALLGDRAGTVRCFSALMQRYPLSPEAEMVRDRQIVKSPEAR